MAPNATKFTGGDQRQVHKECIYDPRSGTGTWREQVTACTSYGCPLFAVRPVSGRVE